MARIISDAYIKQNKQIWGKDAEAPLNQKILAVNAMYGWLYEQGILEKVSFIYKDYEGVTNFALDVKDLLPYRKEMETADLKDSLLAVQHIFDETYTPCMYSGAIELGWPMAGYRSVDGSVGRSWECSLIKSLNTEAIYDILAVQEEKGVKEAVIALYAKFDWQPTLQEKAAISYPEKTPVKFSDLIPGTAGQELDSHFEKNGWELQRWNTGKSDGYQVFFGTGIQVDNQYEYGFPYLYEEDEVIAFANDFYNKHLNTLEAAEATVETICKVTFRNTFAPDKPHIVVYLGKYPDTFTESEGEVKLSMQDRIEAFKKVIDIVGSDHMYDYVISSAEPIEGVWLTVYRDTLGYSDDFDNLTEICVPTDWFLQTVDTGGLSLKEWFNEYTADATDDIAMKAMSAGVILACPDVDIYTYEPCNTSKETIKPKLDDQIQTATGRATETSYSSPEKDKGQEPER